MYTMASTFLFLLLSCSPHFVRSSNDFLFPPFRGVKLVSSQTVTIEWETEWATINLTVYQANNNGGQNSKTLLARASGQNTFDWTPESLDPSVSDDQKFHFNIASGANGNFNSGPLYLYNADVTSVNDVATTAQSLSPTTNLPASTTGSVVTTTSSSAATSSSPAASSSGTEIGLGVGLGLGIPLLLGIGAMIGYMVFRKRHHPGKAYQEATSPPDNTLIKDWDAKIQTQELSNRGAVYEMSEPVHEVPGEIPAHQLPAK